MENLTSHSHDHCCLTVLNIGQQRARMLHNGNLVFHEWSNQKDKKRKERVFEKLRNSYAGKL